MDVELYRKESRGAGVCFQKEKYRKIEIERKERIELQKPVD